jgi:adenine-specific DNA-methyltransferase
MTKLAKEALLKPEQLEKLKELFPQAVVDGKVDFVSLKALLGEQVEEANEKYQFTWNGKQNAIANAQKPSLGTLREDKASSKNFDSTENLYIEGDNLEVLKLLQKTYQGKIKMIYIDPPYNTGNDFVYKDDFKDNVKNYLELTNQKNKSNAETSGRYHTDWLNMMYPRLMLARNLLTDDGVIFISIDDNEQANLKKMCDEIFGEGNFVETFSWIKTETPPNLSKLTKKALEYILCYRKSNLMNRLFGLSKISSSNNGLMNQSNPVSILVFPSNVVDTTISDSVIKRGIYGTKNYLIELIEDTEIKEGIFIKPVKLKGKFKWSQENLNKEILLGTKISIKTKVLSPSYDRIEYEPERPWNIIDKDFGVGTYENGSSELDQLLGNNIFPYPKPSSLIYYLSNTVNDKKQLQHLIVLDFFSGSGTTAHAVMKLNAEDGGKRKFIMVQFPEKTEEDSEAYKAGYKNICEIGKERIRRAGEKVKQEMLEKDSSADVSKLDIGFKVFKLDSTNIKPWDGTQDIQQSLLEASGNVVKVDRTDLDVVHELMLMYGVFNEEIEENKINGKTLYSIGNNFLVVCLFKSITKQDIEAIIKLKPKNVIFNDAGFENDNVKINAELTLKNHGVEDIKSL